MLFLKNQSGVSLIAAIFIIVILAFMGMVFLTLFTTTSSTSINELQSTQALYVAEGGMERAVYQYKKDGTACASLINNNISLGLGNFTTTGTLYNPSPSTTLSGAIGAGDTVIPVASTAGYAPNGRIRIDSEEIFYSSISGNNFIVSQRGAAGTTPANHLANTPVYQNQCLIQSTGTVGNAIRVVQKAETGMSAKQGSFTTRTSNGSQSITGIGFRPKAVIFFWTRQTGTGFGGQNIGYNSGVGFVSGPGNQGTVSLTARDRSNRSDEGRMYSQNYSIIFLSGGGPPGLLARAQFTSMDADGFTLNWTTTDGNAYIINYIALGGDITDTNVGNFTMTTVAGNQDITTIGFQPNMVLFLWSFTGAMDSALARSELGMGYATASSQGGWVVAGADNTGNNVDKRWEQSITNSILMLNTNNPPAQDAIASLTSMLSNGFRINKSNPPANNTTVFYLAMKGGVHKVASFNQATTSGLQAITGVGFKPQQLMLESFNLAVPPRSNDTPQGSNAYSSAISLGAAQSSSSRGNIWFQDRSDNDPSDANMYTSTTDVLTLAYGTANGNNDGNPAVRAQADFASFGTDGFTLNWTTADATQRQILYWAVGPNTSATMWREVFQ